MPNRTITFLAVTAAAPVGAQEAAPVPVPEEPAAQELAAMRAAVASGAALSLSEIMPGVMAAVPGKIIEIHFLMRPKGPVYVIYILTPDWQLFVLSVDARTGEVLNAPPVPDPSQKDQP